MIELLTLNESEPVDVQIERAFLNGCSDIEVCRLLRITFSKFKQMYDSDEGFRTMVDVGRTMSQAYWMEQGRLNITNNKFNTSLWMFNMKNRFGWSEKADVTNYDATPDNIDELRSKLSDVLPRVIQMLKPGVSQSELLFLKEKGNG